MNQQFKSWDSSKNNRQGFTLIELLVVIVIIGILVTLSVPYLNQARTKARETQTASNLKSIHNALESFATDNNGLYPFRIRWFNDSTANAVDFDPHLSMQTGSGLTTDPNGDSLPFSHGLIGGVKLVHPDWSSNIDENYSAYEYDGLLPTGGATEHGFHQPYGYNTYFYRQFNQFSDPLVALGYLGGYPENPFLKRPMGNITYSYGVRNWHPDITYRDENGNLLPNGFDMNIPGVNTLTTPGDFVYTHFYTTSSSSGPGGDVDLVHEPAGVVEVAKSYVVESSDSNVGQHPGVYYLDMVDSYQMWAYGDIALNGGIPITYPNNSLGFGVRGGEEARRDFNNNGVKDMFEIGLVSYYKHAGSTATGARRTSDGAKVEF